MAGSTKQALIALILLNSIYQHFDVEYLGACKEKKTSTNLPVHHLKTEEITVHHHAYMPAASNQMMQPKYWTSFC